MSTDNNSDFLKENFSIDGTINAISVLEGQEETSISPVAVKLRNYTNQVVVATNKFVYKVYETDTKKQAFDHMVQNALAQIYNKLGIIWNLSSFERNNHVFDFEQRQTLQVCTPEINDNFEDILLSISEIYDQIEQILHFDEILNELKKHSEFTSVDKLKLSRTNLNKYNDYAMFGKRAILLDDAEFCIVLLNKNNEILDVETKGEIKISTTLGDFLFKKFIDADKQGSIHIEIPNSLDQVFHGWKLVLPNGKNEAFLANKTTFNSLLLTERDIERATTIQIAEDGMIDDATKLKGESKFFKKDALLINSALTEPSERELYNKLDEAELHSTNVVICTQLNPNGSLLRGKSFVTWSSHMTTISALFSNVEKHTKIYLTQEFCETYLNEQISLKDFCGHFGTEVTFEIPRISGKPMRKTFRKFLIKLARNNKEYLDNFYSEKPNKMNFNATDCRQGHDVVFCAYSDDDGCMMCDFEQIIKGIDYSTEISCKRKI